MSDSHRSSRVFDAIAIIAKEKEARLARDIAHKKHELQQAEFEAIVQNDHASPESIEAARSKMIALYEQYIDSCLVLRTFVLESQKTIDEILKGPSR